MSKIVLITGSSRGIGLATAVTLAQAGHSVVATLRDPSRADALLAAAEQRGVSLDVQPLDVTDDIAVNKTVQYALERYGRIDVLVNNAGGGYLGTTELVPVSAVQRLFDVNVFGVWRMTQAVLPAMREARSGHIVNLSSISGVVGIPFNEVYAATKFALEGMMECLAPVLATFGIHVLLIEPGPVGTAFRQNSGGMSALLAPGPYQALAQEFMQAFQAASGGEAAAQSGNDMAQVILEAIDASAPHFRYQTSEMARAWVSQKLVDPDGDIQRSGMQARLGHAGRGV